MAKKVLKRAKKEHAEIKCPFCEGKGVDPFRVMSPFVSAAATMYVPASILSGMIVCSVARRSRTPSMVMTGLPASSM